MQQQKTKETIYSIQVLRGFASLLVVLFHATENSRMVFNVPFLGDFFHFGAAGVDIFFVLSGFIIMYTSKKYLGQPEALSGFLKKRFVRIYPIYWVTISAFLLALFVASEYFPSSYPTDAGNLINTYLLAPGHFMINGVSWSLTNEVFFYIVFSLAFLVRNRKLLAILGIAYSIFLVVYYLQSGQPANKWLSTVLFSMNLEFVFGVIAANMYMHLSKRLGMVCMITGALAFIGCGLLFNRHIIVINPILDRVLYFGVPGFLLVIGAVAYEKHGGFKNPLGALLDLGDASYSLYLLHLPLLVGCFKIIAKFGITNPMLLNGGILVIVILLCIGSIIFYKLVERPLISRVNKILAVKRIPNQPKQ